MPTVATKVNRKRQLPKKLVKALQLPIALELTMLNTCMKKYVWKIIVKARSFSVGSPST